MASLGAKVMQVRSIELAMVHQVRVFVRSSFDKPEDIDPDSVTFLVGDMLSTSLGAFDYVVAMDSMIHYTATDVVRMVSHLAKRTAESILFTFAPRTPALSVMHTVGRLFPRGNRAPAIEPVSENRLRQRIAAAPGLDDWEIGRTDRIASGFYTSQALELVRG